MRRERDDTDENREQESEKTMCTFENEFTPSTSFLHS